MNLLTLIAIMLIVLGFGQIAAAVAIRYRHAIPRAPNAFHWLLLPAMLVMVACDFTLAWIALTGNEDILGLEPLFFLLAYFGAAALTWWSLVAYAVYHWRRTQRRRAQTTRNTETLQLEAKQEAEDRFSEAELEKTEVRRKLDDAAVVAKREHDEAESRIEAKLDEIIKRLEKR